MNPIKQITAMENDVQALKALNAMNAAEHERLLGKLLLLTAQVALEAHGEFSLASKISDFLSTPFASTEGEQGQVVELADTADLNPAEALTSEGSNPSLPTKSLIFPRTPPSDAGSGAVHRGARPRPQIVICNKERRSIVRSAEERGK